MMKQEIEIWIDGDCEVCRRSQRWCTTRDQDRRLSFRNLHDADGIELPADRMAMMQEVHVRRPDGSLATGYEGWLVILRELEGWSWLATMARWPAVRWIGNLIYAAIAGRRQLVSRIFFSS